MEHPRDPAHAQNPGTVAELTSRLRDGGYLADRGLATTLLVSLSLRRPVLLEGEVGVGKTEVAKVLAADPGDGVGLAAASCRFHRANPTTFFKACDRPV